MKQTASNYFFPMLLASVTAITLTACEKTDTASPISPNQINDQQASIHTDIDKKLGEIIKQLKLTGVPTSNKPIPDINSPKAQLGMQLFYTKTLGGDHTTACATCHHPMLGGGDNLSLSIGTNALNPGILGPHRKLKSGEPGVPRNAPTTFNVAFYKKVLFHDARIERLDNDNIHTPDVNYPQADPLAGETLVQAQARFPITSADEMRGSYMKQSYNQTMRRALANRLKQNWLEKFREGFSDPEGSAEDLITEQNFSEAIAEFERSQVFINNPWKHYIEGDKNALSGFAKKGALLFFTPQDQGGAGCASCHSGDFFTNEKAYNTGMPQIGAGKDSGTTKTNDTGSNLVTGKKEDKFRFRTPSLLNVEVTGPWGHDGAYTSLEGITRHMLAPKTSALNYNPMQLKQNGINIADLEKNTREALDAGLDLTAKANLKENDITYLVSFLKALTDPCVKDRACMSKWIPKADEDDPDGMMLHAINGETGKFL
jgi:cytochrome c peroxidase